MNKWKMVSLGDVCKKKVQSLLINSDFEIEYIDISSIDNTSKKIVSSRVIDAKDAPSRAKQLLKRNDILVSTVRPNLNAVAILKQDSDNVIVGSTGFCILRCTDEVIAEYVFYFCQSKKFINELVKVAKGASYPAVSDSDIKNLPIPLPPLQTQKKIADVLDKSQELIDKRKQHLEKLDEFVQSMFGDMFGDPVKNEKGWKIEKVCEVADIRGRVGWKGYTKSDLRESGPHVLGATHIKSNGTIDLTEPVYISKQKYEESPEIVVQVNDLLIVQRGNTIGKVGLVRNEVIEATINPCILIMRPIKINAEFMRQLFANKNVNMLLWKMNKSTAQPMLTQRDIRNFNIICPPLHIQNQFAQIVEKAEQQKKILQKSLGEMENNFNSIMQRAFLGELF